MNSALLIVISIVWFAFAYKWYGNLIEKKLVSPDDTKSTPAESMNDGVDYYPAKPFVLFGHHFSSIAGAGPILGPVAAVTSFGWGGTVLWIFLGSVFFGAVHDYLALMVSIRHDGQSIPEIAQKVIGTRARNLFSVFVLLTLILVVAVFGFVATQTLLSTPAVVIPTFGMIPVAIAFGYMVYKKNVNLSIGTVFGLAGLFFLIWLGYKFPVSLPFSDTTNFAVWFILLMGYGLIASVLPVWMLLQPRDYLSNWVLLLGLGIGLIGIFISHPTMNAPVYTSFNGSGGPVWPMLFIVVACGAISGFHSIVGSGTTSKQLARESDGKLVGYGAMLLEGVLAMVAVLAVGAGLFWNDAPAGLEQYLLFDVLAAGGPIKAFGMGYGRIVEPLLGIFGALFGITMLKTFVMTTLDTTIRLGRFITAELVGPKVPALKNRYLGSLFIVVPAFYFGYTGTYNIIWPLFGASNQLVAALALLVVSAYLVGIKKPTKYTLYPAIFMIITTIGALCYQGYHHLFGENPDYILGVTSVILIILSLVVAAETKNIFEYQASSSEDAA